MVNRLGDLIVSATNSPAKELDESLLKAIKNLVRDSDSNAKAAAELLMDRLGKKHAQVRFLALLVINELFVRSKVFRGQIVAVLERFLVLCLGFRAGQPLPPPVDRASLLKARALEIVEKWKEMFGPHYKELRLGYEYVKDTLRMEFPNVSEAASRAEEEKNARERRTQDFLRCRLGQLRENFPGLRRDLESTMDQLEECFAILIEEEDDMQNGVLEPVPEGGKLAPLMLDGESEVSTMDHVEGDPGVSKPDDEERDDIEMDTEVLGPDEEQDDEDEEEESEETFGLQSLRSMRDHEELMVTESRDNEAIFNMGRDLLKLIATRHLPATQEWLSVLMRVDPDDRQSRDVLMKEVIDLRNRMVSLKEKCREVGIIEVFKPKASTEDDVDWEDEQVFDMSKLDGKIKQVQEDEQKQEEQAGGSSVVPPSSTSVPPMSDLKKQLLEEAPVLPWGSFLDAWGSDAAVPANTRGLVVDNHWGRVDPDALISSDKMAEMQVRASYYQPSKSEIRPCLAPLRNGRLCQRRDIRKCPLHGTITPRDDQGRPLEDRTSGPRGVMEKRMVVSPAALAAQAVKNVRDWDKKKKKLLRQSRARMDREHNESVLKAAALARDPETIVASIEDKNTEPEISKKRKGGLTAMLRKKEGPKDRIARRLLHRRAVDATAHAGDAAYRESFPNQW